MLPQTNRSCPRAGTIGQSAFFQLSGHAESFKLGQRPETILKQANDNTEELCFNYLKHDELAPFVPKFYGIVEQSGQRYLEMQDLLAKFNQPSVMDIKMGCRTYCEEELDKALREQKLRHDMYDKMVEIDESEPTDEERKVKAITKPRYMKWRETVSSTASLGFRIEGMRLGDGTVNKNFKTIKNEDHIAKAIMRFTQNNKIRFMYLNRLYDLKRALMRSNFFRTHELIGSSLLFVHDDDNANVWLIDFAKTHKLPENLRVTHKEKWELGNHEDGYLFGFDNLQQCIMKVFIDSVNIKA